MKRNYKISIGEVVYEVELISRTADSLTFIAGGETHTAVISSPVQTMERQVSSVSVRTESAQSPSAITVPGSVTAPMPGIVTKVLCKVGDTVRKGQPLLIIEAMKMENNITALSDGEVSTLSVGAGDEVKKGQSLLLIK